MSQLLRFVEGPEARTPIPNGRLLRVTLPISDLPIEFINQRNGQFRSHRQLRLKQESAHFGTARWLKGPQVKMKSDAD